MNKNFSVLIKSKIKRYNIRNFKVDSDKSITHRCLFIAANCIGESKITGLSSQDIDSTINGLRLLGIKIHKNLCTIDFNKRSLPFIKTSIFVVVSIINSV